MDKIFPQIKSPHDVPKLSLEEQIKLAEEVRHIIVQTVAKNGGHLASSLGVVELTIGLLNVFNPDQDNIIWDVGHQSYAWKLLTGRAQRFDTLRTMNGISGFPNPNESKYDHFGVGHSSTSISAALGMAMARDLSGKKDHVIAIIGDGSLTGGMAFEGLNQAGAMEKRLIVVLNDNEMSISRNVGALSLFLSRNMSESWARNIRREVRDLLRSIPGIGEEIAVYAKRTHTSLKSIFTPGMLFEAFNFNYIGPVDGHDLPRLERHLRMAASVDDQPVLLHVLTTKGKGYEPAESDPLRFHGLGKFDPETGLSYPSVNSAPKSYTNVFSETICTLAEKDPRLIIITAAMPEGTGTEPFNKRFPERFVDVGICEQHAVTFAAGLAMKGYRPFVAIYSTFLQRAYDQVIHDICLQNLPVTLCIDRAGLVGEDGPTHHGIFDISFLRHMPNMHIMAPRNEVMLQHMLYTALHLNGPMAIRYPRGASLGMELETEFKNLPQGQGEVLTQGQDIVIMAVGNAVQPALEAAKAMEKEHNIKVSLFDPIWIKPLPEEQILELVHSHNKVMLIEEHTLIGGFSSAVLELLADRKVYAKNITRLGIADVFIEHGTQSQLQAKIGINAENIKVELEKLAGLC